jgi:hypothetical protein
VPLTFGRIVLARLAGRRRAITPLLGAGRTLWNRGSDGDARRVFASGADRVLKLVDGC